MSEVRALVASQNKIKQVAVQEALGSFYETSSVSVDLASGNIESGVRPQPLSLEETAQGVLNRIEKIKDVSGYMVWVAIEGGAYRVGSRWFESACAGVRSADSDEVSVGYGPAYPIPANIARHLEEGMDLNEAMEIETGVAEIGSAGGFNGWLTDGKIDRKTGSATAVLMALYGLKHLKGD